MIDRLTSTHFAQVALDIPHFKEGLTYHVPVEIVDQIAVGMRVIVPLGKRHVIGIVIALEQDQISEKDRVLKSITRLFDEEAVITMPQLALCQFIARYYLASIGETLRLCLPPDTPKSVKENYEPKALAKKKADKAPSQQPHSCTSFTPINLTGEQQHALEQIISQDGHAFLLEGVTGSGKTEVYIQAARHVLAQGKSVLVIAPEIALGPGLQKRFADALGEEVIMLHSGLSNKARRESIFRLLDHKCRVVVGARSALFSPLSNMGLIVVDEEHDGSFKQDESPRYHARDMALWRAHHEGATIILGSATPSLESIYNVHKGKLKRLLLNTRIGNEGLLPEIKLVDLKERHLHSISRQKDRAQTSGQSLCIISGPLQEALAASLSRGEQAMIFLNRRGYSSFALCELCGQIAMCPNCSVSLTYHQHEALLRCHQCDYADRLQSSCTGCGEGPMVYLGLGTERVEQELQTLFPQARLGRLDRDSARNFASIVEITEKMQRREIDILVGTQMIAKGHNFPFVSLVGVVLADMGLSMPDFRAAERTFQLLVQVAGRSGRADTKGQVIIQTFNPSHPAIVCAQQHDTQSFIRTELASREELLQPPFCRATLLRIESEVLGYAEQSADAVKKRLEDLIHKVQEKSPHRLSLLGPAPAPLERLRGKYRLHLYLRATHTHARAQVLEHLWQDKSLASFLRKHKSRLVIDVDPVHLL